MKKLGTPIGTGPGRASDIVGVVSVGIPLGWGSSVAWGRARRDGLLVAPSTSRPSVSTVVAAEPLDFFLAGVAAGISSCSPACGAAGAAGVCVDVEGVIVSESPLLGVACSGVV